MPKTGASVLTAIGCPGCSGVLSEVDEGGSLSYVCTVGHSFSLLGLIEAKEQQLEHRLWSVLSILAHLDIAYRRLLEPVDGPTERLNRRSIEQRLRQVQEDARRVREIIEADRPPDLEPEGEADPA